MIELPETYVLANQLNEHVVGKTIMNVTANAHPHKFAWFSENPETYHVRLSGKKVTAANPGTGYTCGGNTEIICEDMLLVISTPIRFHEAGEKILTKHQLLIEFEDFSSITCTVQMWGAMFCYPLKENGLPKDYKVNKSPTPLEEAFDETYFEKLVLGVKQSMSAKGFLATEQRIPGLGNGVLQDILFNARIHPRTKLDMLSDSELQVMFRSVKSTLFDMTARGGRDTEKDLYGVSGGYQTILSSKTLNKPCPICGKSIVRESYMGGNIYFCGECQKLAK